MKATSWKTTVAGVALILATVAGAIYQYLNTGHIDYATSGAGIVTGWGLIQAKDANVTGVGNAARNPTNYEKA